MRQLRQMFVLLILLLEPFIVVAEALAELLVVGLVGVLPLPFSLFL